MKVSMIWVVWMVLPLEKFISEHMFRIEDLIEWATCRHSSIF